MKITGAHDTGVGERRGCFMKGVMAFSTGNATSRTPSCNGTKKFMSPTMKGIAMKTMMMVPCAERI